MYEELEPLGPTTVGDVAGEFQLTAEGYERSFARRVEHAMGEMWFVVEACFFGEYGLDDNEDHIVLLTRRTQWFWCTDPYLPESTHLSVNTTYDHLAEFGLYHDNFNAASLEDAARTACAELDPASITWSGLPDDIFYGYGEPRPARRARRDIGRSVWTRVMLRLKWRNRKGTVWP